MCYPEEAAHKLRTRLARTGRSSTHLTSARRCYRRWSTHLTGTTRNSSTRSALYLKQIVLVLEGALRRRGSVKIEIAWHLALLALTCVKIEIAWHL